MNMTNRCGFSDNFFLDFTNVLKQNLGHEKLKAWFPIRSTQLENKPYDTLEIDDILIIHSV